MQAHLPTLYGWVLRLEPRWIIELGVRRGVSTVAFLAGLDRLGRGDLWSCDKQEPEVPKAVSEHPRWHLALGDDRKPEKLTPPPPKACELLFIDTSHRLVHTQRELEIYGSRVRGVVLAHDVDKPGCGKAVREWSLQPPRKATYCYGLSATLV
jgi:predicted O-methyltransferase YrrM